MTGKTKVMIVDDDPNARTVLGDLLSEKGFEAVAAQDGEAALEKVRTEAPGVALVDTRLPGMDGYELCRRIKEMRGSKTRVIMYTAFVDAVNVARARKAGADDFLAKVTDLSNLLEAVENGI